MAMDFFENQDHARRQTTRLLVLFALAVTVIILAVYLAGVLLLGGVPKSLPQRGWMDLGRESDSFRSCSSASWSA